jgi:hypothetical protein
MEEHDFSKFHARESNDKKFLHHTEGKIKL